MYEQNFKLCEGETCKLCKRKLLSCVREKLFKLCEIKSFKLCEREHLSCVGEKFKLCEKNLSCVRGKLLSCVRKNLKLCGENHYILCLRYPIAIQSIYITITRLSHCYL